MIDRSVIEKHLRLAEEHVAIGEKNLGKQRAIVSELERDGHPTTEAKRLLKDFEEVQALHLADCARLRQELESDASEAAGKSGSRHP